VAEGKISVKEGRAVGDVLKEVAVLLNLSVVAIIGQSATYMGLAFGGPVAVIAKSSKNDENTLNVQVKSTQKRMSEGLLAELTSSFR